MNLKFPQPYLSLNYDHIQRAVGADGIDVEVGMCMDARFCWRCMSMRPARS